MAGIQGTSLNNFIYMCIVQASPVSTTTCTDHHFGKVSFLSEKNYFATLVDKIIAACLDYLSFEF